MKVTGAGRKESHQFKSNFSLAFGETAYDYAAFSHRHGLLHLK